MALGHQGRGGPPYVRERLKEALALAALDPDKHLPIPYLYAVDQLARRYNVWTRVIEEDPDGERVLRAMEFARMEAAVTVTKPGATPKGGGADPASSPKAHARPGR